MIQESRYLTAALINWCAKLKSTRVANFQLYQKRQQMLESVKLFLNLSYFKIFDKKTTFNFKMSSNAKRDAQ